MTQASPPPAWGNADGLLGKLFGSLLGGYCKASPDDAMCCSCRDDSELLTAAWRHSLDADDALPVVPGPAGGAAEDQRGEPPAASRGVPPVLQVPPEFDLVRLDRFGEAAGAGSRTPEEQQRLLQMCLKTFARALLRGIRMSVLLDDGRTLLTEASLDSELTHLVLHMPNVQCPVALRCIEKICSPDEVSAGAVLTTNQAYLDERCTTLVLRGGQFLTFVFEASRSREYFEMCLKVVILAKGGGAATEGGDEPVEEPGPGSPAPTTSAPLVQSSSPISDSPMLSKLAMASVQQTTSPPPADKQTTTQIEADLRSNSTTGTTTAATAAEKAAAAAAAAGLASEVRSNGTAGSNSTAGTTGPKGTAGPRQTN